MNRSATERQHFLRHFKPDSSPLSERTKRSSTARIGRATAVVFGLDAVFYRCQRDITRTMVPYFGIWSSSH